MSFITTAIDLLRKPELKGFLIPRQTVGRNWFQFSILSYHPSYLINNTRDENNTSFINSLCSRCPQKQKNQRMKHSDFKNIHLGYSSCLAGMNPGIHSILWREYRGPEKPEDDLSHLMWGPSVSALLPTLWPPGFLFTSELVSIRVKPLPCS